MSLYERIKERQDRIAVIGLGYVGLPLAVEFAKKANVIGFDISQEKIKKYRSGIDVTNEVGSEQLKSTQIKFTYQPEELQNAKFFIIAVPTPINSDKTPDLYPVASASELVGKNLTKGSVVVYESTVYPGTTEEVCIPILEEQSGLKCGSDFKVGYSPERINPADRQHTVKTITKIVSGIDNEALEVIAKTYAMVVEAGVHRVSSIKVAEAAKVAENSQRDINIAFMNELAIVFNKMQINTNEVLEAMNTKWNALRFSPGLVGGHCIGVDPYYFIYKAEQIGYHSQIILSGRKVNDSMGEFVADAVIKKLIFADKRVKQCRVAVLGLTFKQNCPDIRNSKVFDIISELKKYGIEVLATDAYADKDEVKKYYGIDSVDIDDISGVDAVVLAVPHDEYLKLGLNKIEKMFGDTQKILIDVKSAISKEQAEKQGFVYWSL